VPSNLTNPELEAHILADRNDLSAYLVYSDWLSERGDPRGELIAIQAKLKERPGDVALEATQAKLMADNGVDWLGPLVGKGDDDVAVRWHLGFLDSVRLGPPLDEHMTSELVSPETIEQLVKLPGIALLRELIVGSIDYDDYPTSWDGCIDALAAHGVPAGLERLEFNRGGTWDISSTELGNLSPLYPRLGTLRELSIEMGSMELGEMNLPALRSLTITTGGLKGGNLESIRKASWPHLERLTICIGESDNDYGCDVQLEDVTKLLTELKVPRLKHLCLANSDHEDAFVGELVRSKLLPQLSSIELSRGTFGNQGARDLLQHAAAFKHLDLIDLTHNYVSPALAARLATIGPRVVLEDSEGTDDEDREDDRYVTISE